ncbi:hypothetical protein K0M31_011524 [Melipona bicolor]|uniref:Uncharacterized protein n=1 Tax=Melipona bicolor TaxID=60889 RepID=A0AA40KV05_9HYME|nr:hypothetical protein K0M31_011524 [Melipona bicolor]
MQFRDVKEGSTGSDANHPLNGRLVALEQFARPIRPMKNSIGEIIPARFPRIIPRGIESLDNSPRCGGGGFLRSERSSPEWKFYSRPWFSGLPETTLQGCVERIRSRRLKKPRNHEKRRAFDEARGGKGGRSPVSAGDRRERWSWRSVVRVKVGLVKGRCVGGPAGVPRVGVGLNRREGLLCCRMSG